MSEKYRMTTAQPSPHWARATVCADGEPILWADTMRPDRIQAMVDDANRGAAAQRAPAVDLDALRERVLRALPPKWSETGSPERDEEVQAHNNCMTFMRERIHAAFDAARKPKEHPDAPQAAGNP